MEEQKSAVNFPPALRATATVFSYLLHPLFIPLLITFLVVTALPEYFVVFKQNSFRFPFDTLYIRVGVGCFLFPLLAVVLSKLLGFVNSVRLEDRMDRIIPYVAITIFYFWVFYTFKRQGLTPGFFDAFFLGIFLAVVVCFVANSFVKISMHTTGWGGVLGFLMMLMWGMGMNVSLPLAIAFVLTGLAATSRLILDAHTTREIYIGLFVGVLSQVVAYAIVG
ncbi:hypothetical protein ACFOTA_11275 [Chitinophaga sp. GCM10012297]|uniref:PAP2 superfamily protein n=1 Tax=Chitinophaga chungangae TaxID=2821488 RepID=A0ABS3YDN2_9BACT|nr:hypothetical protein [Chitinophaga chungangae]MBO9152790.1 hypothetical protein [Chitinophaga chungangae]